MMMHGMNLGNGPMSGMRHPDQNLSLQQQQQQQQTSTMKIENVSLQAAKKASSHFMMGKGMVSSPNLSQTSNSTKDIDIRPQMPSNPILNMPPQQSSMNISQMNSAAATMVLVKVVDLLTFLAKG